MNESINLGIISRDGEATRIERSDAAANRALILETAERLFVERGVANVNMADIAQAAGVGKGTLYRRFADKAELSLALLDRQMQTFQDDSLARLQEMKVNGLPNLVQLERFLDDLAHFTERHSPLLCEVERGGLFRMEMRQNLPYLWEYMTLRGLLLAAQRAGEIDMSIDADYVADALLAPLQSVVFGFQRQRRGFSVERISAGLRSLVEGLRRAGDQ